MLMKLTKEQKTDSECASDLELLNFDFLSFKIENNSHIDSESPLYSKVEYLPKIVAARDT